MQKHIITINHISDEDHLDPNSSLNTNTQNEALLSEIVK